MDKRTKKGEGMNNWEDLAKDIFAAFERIDVLFPDVQRGDAAERLLVEAREHLVCAWSDVRTAQGMVERAQDGE